MLTQVKSEIEAAKLAIQDALNKLGEIVALKAVVAVDAADQAVEDAELQAARLLKVSSAQDELRVAIRHLQTAIDGSWAADPVVVTGTPEPAHLPAATVPAPEAPPVPAPEATAPVVEQPVVETTASPTA